MKKKNNAQTAPRREVKSFFANTYYYDNSYYID